MLTVRRGFPYVGERFYTPGLPFVPGVDPIVALEADWLSDQAVAEAAAGPSPEDVEAEFLACMLQVRTRATADQGGRYSLRYRPTIDCRVALAARIMAHDPIYTVTVADVAPVYGYGSIEISWRLG